GARPDGGRPHSDAPRRRAFFELVDPDSHANGPLAFPGCTLVPVHVRIEFEEQPIHNHPETLLEGSNGGCWEVRVDGETLDPTRRPAPALPVVIEGLQQPKEPAQEWSHALPTSQYQHSISRQVAVARAPQCTAVLEIAHDVADIQV